MSAALVTNGLLSKSLAVVRSLGSRGVRVIASDKTRLHASGFSKFAARTAVYPDPKREPGRFLDWLEKTIRKERVDVLFPTDDDTLAVVVANRARLERQVRLAVPDEEPFRIASDKGLTAQLAERAGVPAPRTVLLPPAMCVEAAVHAVRELAYPLVLKPRFSSGSRGIRMAADADELRAALEAVRGGYPELLVQERIPQGPKLDVCLYYDRRHALQAAFVQREVRHFPVDVGPSTIAVSVRDPELIARSDRLMRHIPWHGVVEVEYMVDPRDGVPKLFEINPRYWASLHVAIRSGVDFPWLMYREATGEPFEPCFDYAEGVMGRALLPGDVLHYASNPDRSRMDPPFWTTKVPDDTVSRSDPMPALGFALSALRHSVDPNMWKMLLRR